MITVVIVYDQAYISGGAAKIAIGEAVELKKRGVHVIYFSAISNNKGDICEELKKNNVETICLKECHIALTKSSRALMKGLWNLNAYFRMCQLLEMLDPYTTIIHIQGWTKALSSSIMLAVKRKGFKQVITLHEYFTICQNGGLYDYKADCICKRKPGSISCFICNCDKRNYMHKIYRDLRQIIQRQTLKTVKPNIIYITNFSENKINISTKYIDSSYRLSNFVDISQKSRVKAEENEHYLFIGRVSAEKGIDIFCESITRCNVKGVVIGDGPLREKYKIIYPKIDFVGWKSQKEMATYLLEARALIIASKWYETMGLTIVEMQQYGIPCIVPHECAASEYVQENVTGLLYHIGNVDSLCQSISIMTDSEKSKNLSLNFYESIDFEKYSIINHINKLENIYFKILDL